MIRVIWPYMIPLIVIGFESLQHVSQQSVETCHGHDVLNCDVGLMLNSLVEDLCEMSLHPTCFYVVQRLISLCAIDELCLVASAILPRCMEIASSDKGCHVVHNLLEMLVSSIVQVLEPK